MDEKHFFYSEWKTLALTAQLAKLPHERESEMFRGVREGVERRTCGENCEDEIHDEISAPINICSVLAWTILAVDGKALICVAKHFNQNAARSIKTAVNHPAPCPNRDKSFLNEKHFRHSVWRRTFVLLRITQEMDFCCPSQHRSPLILLPV